ncbi:cAMP-activated global transcriptional regulator CRP [Novipirellula artificiosorum]|uniref:cAMP-activated global transcriptional regulator CRP n=2 Tax=Novipirellula artificiosorum TaxID=2528016 RepID=A0A5C6DX67_9BACT|nr:cAMP-activated global transcriptional regulator CRP [Novipirellula artificiosorum]
MRKEQTDLLRRMPAFGGLQNESIELILFHSREWVLEANDYFFREGEPGDSLFVIEIGTVLIQRSWKGTPIVLGRLAGGDCFGEMSLIDFQKRSASVIAESSCQAIEVPSKSLRSLFQHDLEQYAMIMMNLGREVSRRLRAADECLFQLQQDPTMAIESRVAT